MNFNKQTQKFASMCFLESPDKGHGERPDWRCCHETPEGKGEAGHRYSFTFDAKRHDQSIHKRAAQEKIEILNNSIQISAHSLTGIWHPSLLVSHWIFKQHVQQTWETYCLRFFRRKNKIPQGPTPQKLLLNRKLPASRQVYGCSIMTTELYKCRARNRTPTK